MPVLAQAAVSSSEARIRLLPPGVPNTAAYVTVLNSGEKDITIVGAQSDVAERVELHNHVMDDGMMSMQKQDEIPLPAGSEVRFQPGGYHIMLFDLKAPLSANTPVSIRLLLDNGQSLMFSAKPQKPQSEHHH
ncbi:hypothetical protein HMF8227_02034 [Saliniradius amylolyticus]|uniref:Copper chaperone PCu(A)C n=2 Tax=Saliniradius amylolyticus TaxID=2183582 RepID=A0A2S2E4I1_9ALTE|nr:hypothetical protein HMF8227_02034 [Saliniradius amylolyticus]